MPSSNHWGINKHLKTATSRYVARDTSMTTESVRVNLAFVASASDDEALTRCDDFASEDELLELHFHEDAPHSQDSAA